MRSRAPRLAVDETGFDLTFMNLIRSGWILSPPVGGPDAGVLPDVIPITARAPPGNGERRIALLIHGVATTWQFMAPLARDLATLSTLAPVARRPLYDRILLVAHDWRLAVEENAVHLRRLLDSLAGRDRRIDLFGYSQGGLLARLCLESSTPGIEAPVGAVVTFNAPHAGSPLVSVARLLFGPLREWNTPGIRDLGAGSDLLGALARGRPPAGTRYVFVAGSSGQAFLGGITRPLFRGTPHDGVASVTSQLDRSVPEGPDRWLLEVPWDHFTLGRGLVDTPATGSDGAGNGGPAGTLRECLLAALDGPGSATVSLDADP